MTGGSWPAAESRRGAFGFHTQEQDRSRSSARGGGRISDSGGGSTATEDFDPDGTLFVLVRQIVGPDAPVVAALDLHANVSPKMFGAVDMLCSYLTNPHMDQYERGAESALAIDEILFSLSESTHM